jgi:hypothetical protein
MAATASLVSPRLCDPLVEFSGGSFARLPARSIVAGKRRGARAIGVPMPEPYTMPQPRKDRIVNDTMVSKWVDDQVQRCIRIATGSSPAALEKQKIKLKEIFSLVATKKQRARPGALEAHGHE